MRADTGDAQIRRHLAAPKLVAFLLLAIAIAAIAVPARGALGDSAAGIGGSQAQAGGGDAPRAPDAGSEYRPESPKYIGSVYCYACHQDLALEFARTKMGELFLVKPQNDLERKGCEGCHGPGSAHAESGGGLGVGGLIEFRIDHGQPIRRANKACLECHDEAFWHGKTHGLRRMACFDCHVVMVRMSPTFQLAPAAADESWNAGRTWRDAALLGLLAGIVLGGWRRLRPRRKS